MPEKGFFEPVAPDLHDSEALRLVGIAEAALLEARTMPGYKPCDVDPYLVVHSTLNQRGSGNDPSDSAEAVRTEAFRLTSVTRESEEKQSARQQQDDNSTTTKERLATLLTQWQSNDVVTTYERKTLLRWANRIQYQSADIETWAQHALALDRQIQSGEVHPSGDFANTVRALFETLPELSGSRHYSADEVQAEVMVRLEKWIAWRLRLDEDVHIENALAYLLGIRSRVLADLSKTRVVPLEDRWIPDSASGTVSPVAEAALSFALADAWARCVDVIDDELVAAPRQFAEYVEILPRNARSRRRLATTIELAAFIVAVVAEDVDQASLAESSSQQVVASFWGGLVRFTNGKDTQAQFLIDWIGQAMRARHPEWKRRYGNELPRGSNTEQADGAFLNSAGEPTKEEADYRRTYRYRNGEDLTATAPFGHGGVAGMLADIFARSIRCVGALEEWTHQ